LNGSTSGYTQIQAAATAANNTLTLPNSGTNLLSDATLPTTTPTNGQIPIGNGTTYVPATITAGSNITVTNGAGTITIAASATSPQVYSQLFTASGTWTAPTGVTRVRVWCVGGGAGAALFPSGCPVMGFGGAGGVSVGVYTVSPGTGYTVTIGAGGAGVSSSTNITGGPGGTTSFGGVISATGGSGGNSQGNGFVTNGSTGAGSSGTVYNSSAVSGSQAATYIPASIGPVNMSTALYAYAPTATAVAASGQYGAGNGGSGTISPSKGGVGGMVYLEWVQ
jgi:hypothetical protein